jgi:RNA polymerase sigma factor (sigma-70 family)
MNRAIRRQLDQSSLSAERERALLECYQNAPSAADRQAALTELWESHSKLVVSIAVRYRRSGLELLDLIGAGHIGLYTAISRFDTANYDSRLSSFAVSWIRWAITDHIRRNTTVMRLPETTAHRQLVAMREKLFRDARISCLRDQVQPTDDELNERVGYRIGMTGTEVANSLRLLSGAVVSLHAPHPVSAASLEDTLRDDDAGSEDDVIHRLDQAKTRRRVLALVHDILGERERIHQLEASARRKVTTALLNEGYGDRPDHTPTPRRASGGDATRGYPATSRRTQGLRATANA